MGMPDPYIASQSPIAIPDVVVSLPCYDSYKRDMIRTLIDMLAYSAMQGVKWQGHFCGGSNICINRIDAVYQARETQASWILFIDSDMAIPVDLMTRLVSHDVDIVSGVYFGKVRPFMPIVARWTDPTDHSRGYTPLRDIPDTDQLMEVDGVGGGCLLVKTEVFDKIPEPFFEFKGPVGQKYPYGEDWTFCQKAQDAGYKIWCDPLSKCGHIGDATYTVNHFDLCKPKGMIDVVR